MIVPSFVILSPGYSVNLLCPVSLLSFGLRSCLIDGLDVCRRCYPSSSLTMSFVGSESLSVLPLAIRPSLNDRLFPYPVSARKLFQFDLLDLKEIKRSRVPPNPT